MLSNKYLENYESLAVAITKPEKSAKDKTALANIKPTNLAIH